MPNIKLITILNDLKEDIDDIEDIMEEVATGQNSYQECDKEYKKIYFSIDTKLTKLNRNRHGLEMDHDNNYLSLKDFYSYYSEHFNTYKERRAYIQSLYHNLNLKIHKLLVNLNQDGDEDFGSYIVHEEKYLLIENVPDDFYRQLIDLINECYSKGVYSAVSIFSRKLLESLIVDILKKKYGTTNIDIFYNKDFGQYNGFNTLLKEFDGRLKDFKIDMQLDKSFIKSIGEFREKGNVKVHVLELDLKKDKNDLDTNQDQLTHIVRKLIRLLNISVPIN